LVIKPKAAASINNSNVMSNWKPWQKYALSAFGWRSGLAMRIRPPLYGGLQPLQTSLDHPHQPFRRIFGSV
jgi:hypothetical protein